MFDISNYRREVLDVLTQTGNHYDTELVTLKRLGTEINYHRWKHPYQGDWEVDYLFTEEILSNLKKIIRPNSTVIDIGAQTGNMSVAYSLFADKVISFEPNPATFEVLQKNSNLNTNIHPYNYAVSDMVGPLTFHYSDNGFCNGGFATRTHRGIGVTGQDVLIFGNLSVTGGNNIINANSIAVGTNTINSSAIIQADSTSRGFLPPRMTASQANAISTSGYTGDALHC